MRPTPVGLGRHPLGELRGDLGVVLAGEGLGEQAEGADRRLELVADVGHEVAPDRLDAPGLGHVPHETHRTDPAAVGRAAVGRS